jgi:hypothetical protein
MAKDGLGECWSAVHYVDGGEEDILKKMSPEYADTLRGIRRARLEQAAKAQGN